jgi:hypothetical protein
VQRDNLTSDEVISAWNALGQDKRVFPPVCVHLPSTAVSTARPTCVCHLQCPLPTSTTTPRRARTNTPWSTPSRSRQMPPRSSAPWQYTPAHYTHDHANSDNTPEPDLRPFVSPGDRVFARALAVLMPLERNVAPGRNAGLRARGGTRQSVDVACFEARKIAPETLCAYIHRISVLVTSVTGLLLGGTRRYVFWPWSTPLTHRYCIVTVTRAIRSKLMNIRTEMYSVQIHRVQRRVQELPASSLLSVERQGESWMTNSFRLIPHPCIQN